MASNYKKGCQDYYGSTAQNQNQNLKLFNSLGCIPFKEEVLINRCANTRYSNVNLVCPLFKKSTEGAHGRTFTVRTIRDWNNLDVKFKQIHSLSIENFLKPKNIFKV